MTFLSHTSRSAGCRLVSLVSHHATYARLAGCRWWISNGVLISGMPIAPQFQSVSITATFTVTGAPISQLAWMFSENLYTGVRFTLTSALNLTLGLFFTLM